MATTGRPLPESGIAGVILAGGAARRMGGTDKPLEPLGGRAVLAHVMERLGPQVTAVALNANDDPARFSGFGLDVVPDTVAGRPGPLAGVLAGMVWAARRPEAFSHIVTVAGDTPFLPADLVAGLEAMAGLTGRRICIARSLGRDHPVFGYWPVDLAGDLAEFLARSPTFRVSAYAFERHDAAYADFPAPGGRDPFFNINTPSDLDAAEEMLREASA